MSSDLPDYMTPHGYATLAKELEFLTRDERPKITEIVSWAAGNGDRSENGDYIYNKKRLREIDRRIRYLTKKLENAKVVDPKQQQHLERVFFGAEVTYARADNSEVTVKLVGVDEADFTQNKINWLSPVGRALMKAQVGDTVKVAKGSGDDDTSGEDEWIEVLEIVYKI